MQIGEEAVAAGVMSALQPQDAVVATYREHGHALLRGVTAESILAEMYGRQEGCCSGRTWRVDAPSTPPPASTGGNAIVAGGLPLAVGLAPADKMQGRDRVTACFFGDGAVAEGEFHESLNLAAPWQLPVLFVCENNLYAMGTALRQRVADRTWHSRPPATRSPRGRRTAWTSSRSPRPPAALSTPSAPAAACTSWSGAPTGFRAH